MLLGTQSDISIVSKFTTQLLPRCRWHGIPAYAATTATAAATAAAAQSAAEFTPIAAGEQCC